MWLCWVGGWVGGKGLSLSFIHPPNPTPGGTLRSVALAEASRYSVDCFSSRDKGVWARTAMIAAAAVCVLGFGGGMYEFGAACHGPMLLCTQREARRKDGRPPGAARVHRCMTKRHRGVVQGRGRGTGVGKEDCDGLSSPFEHHGPCVEKSSPTPQPRSSIWLHTTHSKPTPHPRHAGRLALPAGGITTRTISLAL